MLANGKGSGGDEGEDGGDVAKVEDDGTGEEGVLEVMGREVLTTDEGVSVNFRLFLFCCSGGTPSRALLAFN